MIRGYKFLLRPTVKQAQALTACLAAHRELSNAALQERRDAYRKSGVTVRYGDQSAQLKDIRAARPGIAVWSFSSQQATLRRLDKAFAAFFRRVKAGQTPGYPRFKGATWFDTVIWPRDRDGCRWDATADSGQIRVYLHGVGQVRVHAHRKVAGTVKTIAVNREGRRWSVVLSCADVPAELLPDTGRAVGIDVGIASFVTTSDGAQIPNPRHGRRNGDRLAEAQRALSRCQRGSNRRRKVRDHVAELHAKVRRQRLDHAHKTALWLVRRHDVIVHEDLGITNMTRSPAPRPDGAGGYLPNGAAARAGLNRSILDPGWGVFLNVLHAKAESAGRVVVEVDPRDTSRTCPACAHCAQQNRLTQADFVCVACGYAGHADVVGAFNVLRAGLAHQAG